MANESKERDADIRKVMLEEAGKLAKKPGGPSAKDVAALEEYGKYLGTKMLEPKTLGPVIARPMEDLKKLVATLERNRKASEEKVAAEKAAKKAAPKKRTGGREKKS